MIQMQFDARTLEFQLSGMQQALRDLTPVWGDIHQIFLKFMDRVFKAEGAYAGPHWVPLNPGYAAWKLRNYGALPILQLTGALRRSFVEASDPAHVYRTGPSFMETGSSVRYARAHQWGFAPRNLPARPMLSDVTKVEGEAIADAVLAYLLRSGRPAGTAGV